jgi:tetratricopeptide (TPR) repeat protein
MLGNRAIIHDQAGEWAQGHAKLRRAVKLDAESIPLWGELCWNGGAGSPDPAGALPDCDKAIELNPNPNNFNSRGMAYYRAGKFVEAIADYDRSIDGDPKVGSSWYMRGLAKQAAGVDGGQADIDKGLELEPGVRERYVRVGILPPG